MEEINVLIAFCGSLATGPNLISLLRGIKEKNINIIGVDSNEENPARFMVDRFYKCPKNKNKFVNFIKEVCLKEKIDIILPTSTENSLMPLKKNINIFDEIGVLIPGMEYHDLQKINDKGCMLESLEKSALPCAKFGVPKTLNEFDKHLAELGYPKKMVVVKPAVSSGNRGFRILKEGHSFSYGDLIKKNNEPFMDANNYRKIIEEENDFPNIVMMEYLPGQDYSIYCLAKSGASKAIIPFKRLKPGPGLSYISQISMDKRIISLCEKIIEHFNLDWNVNIQMRGSADGQPLVYEINPRIAGSIVLTRAAGCNLLHHGIKQILGEKGEISKPRDGVKMYRYLTEVYV